MGITFNPQTGAIDFTGTSGGGGGLTGVADTNSIDLTNTSGTVTADLRLSSNAADASFFLIANDIESTSVVGLRSQIRIADTTHTGAISSTDWNTFNNKQSALSFPLAITLGGTNSSASLTGAKLICSDLAGTKIEESAIGLDIVNSDLFDIHNIALAGSIIDTVPHDLVTPLNFDGDTNPYDVAFTGGISPAFNIYNLSRTLNANNDIAGGFASQLINLLNANLTDNRNFSSTDGSSAFLNIQNQLNVDCSGTITLTSGTTPLFNITGYGLYCNAGNTYIWNCDDVASAQQSNATGMYVAATCSDQVNGNTGGGNLAKTMNGFWLNAVHFLTGSGDTFTNTVKAANLNAYQYNFGFSGTKTTSGFGADINVSGYEDAYGIRLGNIFGINNSWGFYNLQACNNVLTPDAQKNFLGSSLSASIGYDGTNLVINTAENNTGILDMPAASGWTTTTPLGAIRYLKIKADDGNVYMLIGKQA